MIARHVIARLLETFFSKWWLYILPVVALTGLGIYTAGSKADTYRSTAILKADVEPLITDLQGFTPIDSEYWESSAEAMSRQINEELHTDAFLQEVATAAGIPADSTEVTLLDVREAVSASAGGRSLLAVRASTVDPVLAQALVQSTIDTFIQSVIDDQISTATTTLEYLKDQQVRVQADYDAAADARNKYLAANPPPVEGDRPIEVGLEISRLSTVVDRVDARLAATGDNILAAELLIEQATSDAAQTLSVVDPPTVPIAPEAGLRAVVMTVATFAVLGMLLMLGAVVAASLLDRSLRFAEEVRASLGVEV
ncbi:MAG: hypothetical protein ACRDZZ_13355, partial [Ilumatobacteraceae bacterium]